MKAAIYNKYGPPEVFTIADVPTPIAKDDEVLVKVYASSVNPYDCHFRSGFLPVRLMFGGLTRPKKTILGLDVAGTIESVGNRVKRLRVGDRVYGFSGSAYAEYTAVQENRLCAMPSNLDFRQAAALPLGALTALQVLRDIGHIGKGKSVLIHGASGGIGTIAVQLARYYEAEVTAVCSAANLSWVKALGADYAIDYAREDFTKNGRKYDLIYKVRGTPNFFGSRSSLSEDGTWVSEDGSLGMVLLTALFGGKKAKMHMTKSSYTDFDFIKSLVEAGEIKPIVDRSYSLDQIAEAHRHAETKRTKGKIVIDILSSNGVRPS